MNNTEDTYSRIQRYLLPVDTLLTAISDIRKNSPVDECFAVQSSLEISRHHNLFYLYDAIFYFFRFHLLYSSERLWIFYGVQSISTIYPENRLDTYINLAAPVNTNNCLNVSFPLQRGKDPIVLSFPLLVVGENYTEDTIIIPTSFEQDSSPINIINDYKYFVHNYEFRSSQIPVNSVEHKRDNFLLSFKLTRGESFKGFSWKRRFIFIMLVAHSTSGFIFPPNEKDVRMSEYIAGSTCIEFNSRKMQQPSIKEAVMHKNPNTIFDKLRFEASLFGNYIKPLSLHLQHNSIDNLVTEGFFDQSIVHDNCDWDRITNYFPQIHPDTIEEIRIGDPTSEHDYVYKSKKRYFFYFLVICGTSYSTHKLNVDVVKACLGDVTFFYSSEAQQRIRHEHAIVCFRNPKTRGEVERRASSLYMHAGVVATPIWHSIEASLKYIKSQEVGASYSLQNGILLSEVKTHVPWMNPALRELGIPHEDHGDFEIWVRNGMPVYPLTLLTTSTEKGMLRAAYSNYLRLHNGRMSYSIQDKPLLMFGDDSLARRMASIYSDDLFFSCDSRSLIFPTFSSTTAPVTYLFETVVQIITSKDDLENSTAKANIMRGRLGEWGNLECIIITEK